MHEETTFFDAKRSRSQNNRRANSVPPALYGMTGEDVAMGRSRNGQGRRRDSDVEDMAYDSALESGLDAGRGRGRERTLPRSASALPGIHDGSHGWHRDGFSRRPSYDADSSRPPSHPDNMPTMARLNLEDTRGPSPAYTPTVEASTVPLNPPNGQHGGRASRARESVLSPIQSAVPSRATSERDGSTETQNRRMASDSQSPSGVRLDDVQEQPTTSAGASAGNTPPSEPEASASAGVSTSSPPDGSGTVSPVREVSRTEIDEEHGHAIRSILTGSASGSRTGSSTGTPRSRPSVGGEVRFAPADPHAGPSRAEANGDYHPAGSAIQAISAVSTAHNSPAPSRPQSVRGAESAEDLSVDLNEQVLADVHAPVVSSPLAANFAVPTGLTDTQDQDTSLGRVSSESAHSTHSRRSNLSMRSSRSNASLRSATTAGGGHHAHDNNGSSSTSPRSSLLRSAATSSAAAAGPASSGSGSNTPATNGVSAASSTTSLQEIRQGRKNRLGSHSTIVINTDPNVAPLPPIEAISSNPSSPRPPPSTTGGRASLGPSSGSVPQRGLSPYGQPQGYGDSSSSGAEDRGRKGTGGSVGAGGGRFSLAATLRGLSKDVKDRVRASSRSKSRAGFGSAGGGSTADLSNYPGTGAALASGSSLRGRGITPGGGRDGSNSRSRSTTRHNSASGDGLLPPPMPSRIERSPSNLGHGAPQPDRVRAMRTGSFTRQDPDFVPPYGRGGAGRVNSASRERERERSSSRRATSRTDSPGPASMDRIKEEEGAKKGKRSESRGRGRHMGMKVLTDALGLGDHGHADASGQAGKGKDEGEGYRDEHGDLHNWKEFRKGKCTAIASLENSYWLEDA